MTRICLIRPPVVTLPEALATHGPVPPVGLAYIAAVLRDAGHAVSVIDAPMAEADRRAVIESPIGPLARFGLSPAEIVERIDADVDVVGITNMFLHEWPQVREIARLVRERFPEVFVMVGGETATSFSERILEESLAVDCCVRGEGETTALEVIDRVASGRSLVGLSGVAVREREPVAAVPVTGTDAGPTPVNLPVRLRRLDEVPRPAWDLFPLENYWHTTSYFGVDRGRAMPVLATRGCPYKCTFCSSPQMWTTRYVVRDAADVVDEIADYVDRFGIRNVNFCDLTAITKRKWTLQFCDELDRRGLDITWQLPVGTRSEALDAEVLRRLYETGCRNITYAPESGSERMLAVMDKKVDLDHMMGSLRAAHAIGLTTHVNIIIGHPAERWPDLAKSLRFLLRAAWVGCNDAAPSIFAPYPGSADYDDLVAAGAIDLDESIYYASFSRSSVASRSYNPQMSANQLRVVQMAMLAVFYAVSMTLRPARLVSFVRSLFGGRESNYLEQMLRTKRRSRSGGRGRGEAGPEPAGVVAA